MWACVSIQLINIVIFLNDSCHLLIVLSSSLSRCKFSSNNTNVELSVSYGSQRSWVRYNYLLVLQSKINILEIQLITSRYAVYQPRQRYNKFIIESKSYTIMLHKPTSPYLYKYCYLPICFFFLCFCVWLSHNLSQKLLKHLSPENYQLFGEHSSGNRE